MNLAIDLDGTLAEWKRPDGYEKINDPDHPSFKLGVGEWVDGAREAVETLLDGGHRVVVHSCRATLDAGGGWRAIAEFLRSGGFRPALVKSYDDDGLTHQVWQPLDDQPQDDPGAPTREVGIWLGNGKPIAHFYVDDRAIPFMGSWSAVLAGLGVGEP